jgi:hypothetical protein
MKGHSMPKPIIKAEKPERVRDLTGETFGSWTVLGYVGYRKYRRDDYTHFWKCKCKCGREKNVRGNNLLGGTSTKCRSCSTSISKTKHGLYGSPEYKVWGEMMQRCYNPNYKDFSDWGGRGIKVCPRWHKFENFYKDMGPRPSKNHSLDRIDNDGDYSPENCRWATWKEQTRNKRNNVWIEYKGKKYIQADLVKLVGVSEQTIRNCRKRGESIEHCLERREK